MADTRRNAFGHGMLADHADSKTLQIVIERGEDSYYVAHCPALKSCWSQGRTRDEALSNIREAIEFYFILSAEHTREWTILR